MGRTEYRRRPLEERFWKKVNRNGMVAREGLSNCWEWTASKRAGYGAFNIGGKMFGAHVIAYKLKNGPIPYGLWVLHYCDNRACVRHLELGNQSKNLSDCVSRGRNGNAKLTPALVSRIRTEYDLNRSGIAELSSQYGVGINAISKIIKRLSWK